MGFNPLTATSSNRWCGRLRCVSAALLSAVFSGACASPPTYVVQASDVEIRQMPAQEEIITLREGKLPGVTLTPDILYKLLAAEFAAQRGAFLPAADTTLELARLTADPRLAQRAVEFYMTVGHYAGALDSVNAWLVIEPDNEEAASMRLALMAATGRTEGLVGAIAKQVIANPDKTEGLAQAMGILGRMPDRRVALDIMAAVIEESGQKGTMAGHMAMADMAQSAGDYSLAFTQAQQALKLDPKSEDAVMRVLDYGMQVDSDAALEAARQFAKKYPKSRRLRLMLAGRLAEQGQVDAAIEELRVMSTQFPEDFDLLYIRAQLAYQAGRLDAANQLLGDYVEVQKQRESSVAAGASDATAALSDAYSLMAAIAEQQGQFDRAVELLGRIDDPATKYSSRLRQARIRADQGRVDEAVRMIDAAHPADQDEQLIGVLTLTQILRQAGRNDQAIARLTAADKEILDSVEIKYELGMLLERQGDLPGMERYMRQVIELDPGYAHAYNALGYTLADRGERLEEAYQLIRRANEIRPDDPYILDSLGWVKYRQGDLEQARKYLQQAFDSRPESEIAAHLGEVLWNLGEQDRARQVWKQGLQINPEDRVLLETIKRFGVSL